MSDIALEAKTNNKLSNPIIIIGVLFFVFGFVTWLGSVLIPYLKIVCELNDTEPYFVAFSFYISYAVMAIPSAIVLKKTGFKNGMALGLFIMAIGTLLFVPAAKLRLYGLFLTGLYIQGTGLAILQTASNPYVTILGPRESAAKRISIMGVCNGIASSLSPLILGAAILSGADDIKNKLAHVSIKFAKVFHTILLVYIVITIYKYLIRYYVVPYNLDSSGAVKKVADGD